MSQKSVHRVNLRALAVALGLLGLVAALAGCEGSDTKTVVPTSTAAELRERFALKPLPAIPYPPDNPARQERISLGRLLFFDPILGGEKDVACGTCHHPDFAFADSRQFGAGVSGSGLGSNRILGNSAITNNPITDEPRNTPTCFNTGFNADESGMPSHDGFQFWDGRVKSLEDQAVKPITSRVEMRGDAYSDVDALDSVLARLREIPEYVTRFQAGFPAEALVAAPPEMVIDSLNYARAIASYERELVTRNSRYDQFVTGDDNALTAQELQGLELFHTKAKCAVCHSGPMFSDFEFVVQGVPQEGPGKDMAPGDDLGRQEFTGAAVDKYAFRTPTLRNAELTPPYMHDGVFETLEEVLRFYNDGASPRHPLVTNAMLDPDLTAPLGLTEEEMQALVAFMRSLTDDGTALPRWLVTVPERVPSGLMPVFGVGDPGSGKIVYDGGQ
ncbi:MAG TPA: cytochrome c peroxidase [candidate division Zixibacteria bacterium]|nr:cytochrome c peroxidase [candidate division Zixibacteria bacterium]